ncbi:MAG: TlpA family protein disulfide reductase [Firmicutes bacterium]|nr:TlpA family protein disulfide reductase [Bacillota bacterium]
MRQKAGEWRQQGIEIVIVTSDSESATNQFFAEKPVEATVLLDSDGRVFEKYEVYGIPASFLADRQGVLRYPSVGWDDDGGMQKLQSQIDNLSK